MLDVHVEEKYNKAILIHSPDLALFPSTKFLQATLFGPLNQIPGLSLHISTFKPLLSLALGASCISNSAHIYSPGLVLPINGPQHSDASNGVRISTLSIWDDFNLSGLRNAYGDALAKPCSVSRGAYGAPTPHYGVTALVERLRIPITDGARFLGARAGCDLPVSASCDEQQLYSADRPSVKYVLDTFGVLTDLVVGSVRPSSTWSSSGLQSGQPHAVEALQQLATHALQVDTRYAFLLTDRELVVVRFFNKSKERDDLGAQWQTIPWAASGEESLTVKLAIWSLVLMSLNADHRAITIRGSNLRIGSWLREKRYLGQEVYRHLLSLRELNYLPHGEISLNWFG